MFVQGFFEYESAFFGPFLNQATIIRLMQVREYVWNAPEETWEGDRVAATVLDTRWLCYARHLINTGRISEYA